MDDTYEVTTELQDYDDKKGFLPIKPYPDATAQQNPAAYILGRIGICLVVIIVLVLLLIFLMLGIILGITMVTLIQLPTCNTSATVVSPYDTATAIGSNYTMANVSCNTGYGSLMVINKTEQLQEQVALNDAKMRAEIQLLQTKMNEILNKTTISIANDNDQRNLTETILKTTGDSVQMLMNIVNTLSNVKDTCSAASGVADSILLVVEELLVLHNDSTALPSSCAEIKSQQPNSPSGVYLTAPPTGGAPIYTYCHMGQLCGSGGGWTRLAYLDMSDATQNCPSGFRLYQSGGVRACGRPSGGAGCTASIQFPSNGISYSQICGRVTGYQYNSPDAVSIHNGPNHNNLNADYVDGVSITRGSPRQHVWTLIAGITDNGYNDNNCPCASPPGSNQQLQSFVGNNYFCESGNPGHSGLFYPSDPLWDGQGCGSNEGTCCAASGLPWFHRDYGANTTYDYIELRICGDENTANEDTPVGFYEIYVK
uniref:Fibrinogen C-terminal domain-containing protein n=1 Tax=Amphimedon queenslandica TaxID=400682 RepID=A0A1X7UXA4_AMPQE